MSLISDLVSGGLSGIISPISNTVTAIFTNKQNTDLEKFKVNGQVDLTLVNAHVAILKLNADLLKSKWMIRLQVAFGGPLALFYAKCLVWDKVLADWTHGHTDPLAGDIATYSTWIVAFLFMHSAVTEWSRKT